MAEEISSLNQDTPGYWFGCCPDCTWYEMFKVDEEIYECDLCGRQVRVMQNCRGKIAVVLPIAKTGNFIKGDDGEPISSIDEINIDDLPILKREMPVKPAALSPQ